MEWLREPSEGAGREDVAWLDQVVGKVKTTTEWQAFTQTLYIKIQKALEENKVYYFSSLSEDEKMLMIDGIEENIMDGNVYRNFTKMLNDELELGIVSRLQDDKGVSRTEQIVRLAAEGATCLLDRIPTTLSTVRLLINQSIPAVLRIHVWGMTLHDEKARDAYRNRATNRNRITTISESDKAISDRCQDLFDMEFANVEDATSSVMICKTVLSYRMTLLGEIEDCEYYLAVPLAVVLARSYSDLPRVVEAMHVMTGMKRPRCQSTNSLEAQTALSDQAETFFRMVERADPELHQHILDAVQAQVEQEEKDPGMLAERLGKKLRFFHVVDALVDNVFVGSLSLEACLYVWDQCLLVGFDKLVLPFAVCVLVLLRKELQEKPTLAGIRQTLRQQAKSITVNQLINKVEELYMDEHVRKPLGLPLRNTSHFSNDPTPPLEYQYPSGLDAITGGSKSVSSSSPRNEETKVDSEGQVKERLEKRLSELYPPLPEKPAARPDRQISPLEPASSRSNDKQPQDDDDDDDDEKKKKEEDEDEETKKKKAAAGAKVVDRSKLKLPTVEIAFNGLSDTLLRAKHLNPEVDIKELEKILREEHPAFEDHMSASDPVLRLAIGGKKVFFRALHPFEPIDRAADIVNHELNRAGVGLERAEKLTKHLIKYSERENAKGKQDGGGGGTQGAATAAAAQEENKGEDKKGPESSSRQATENRPEDKNRDVLQGQKTLLQQDTENKNQNQPPKPEYKGPKLQPEQLRHIVLGTLDALISLKKI